MNNVRQSRRDVLRFGLKAAAACGLASSAPAWASSSSNRAAVCLYFTGGNDSNNMIVPLGSPEYELYAKGRGSLAISRNALLSVEAKPSARYGFHPNLPGVQGLYNRGALAVLANVGRSEAGLTAAQIKVSPAAVPADLLAHQGSSDLRYVSGGYITLVWAPGSSARGSQSIATLSHGITMTPRQEASARQHSSTPLFTRFPQTPVGQQLETVVNELLTSSPAQQLFFCPVGSFDTHGDQAARQSSLFSEVDAALVAFYSALEEMGITDRVTLFTRTEFNRTLAPNQTGGTEHAWGGHQLILGGAVFGGQVHGTFPSLELGGADDLGQTGVWIPSASNIQYDATIAAWLGHTDLASLPGLQNLRLFFPANLGLLTP
jgi:uncharacterized protein (DUF1501 family)